MMLPDDTSLSNISLLIPTILSLKALNSDLEAGFYPHSIIQIIEEHLKNMQTKLEPNNQKITLILNSEQRFLMEMQVEIIEKLLILIKNTRSLPSRASKFTTSDEILMKPYLLEDILDRSKRILESLFGRTHSSNEEHTAFSDEIRRLDLIRAFFFLRSDAPNYHPEGGLLEEMLLRNVKKFSSQEEVEVRRILELLSKKLGIELGISDGERRDNVRAIGLSKGHWYKCPEGHIFGIGGSRAPNQESICPHCRASMGGRMHGLQSDDENQ